jgi:signal transduction histidine kinase
MKGWWRDTLFKRLFVLLWVALVASHLLGFFAAHTKAVIGGPQGGFPGRPQGEEPAGIGTMPLPSLPPGLTGRQPFEGGPGPDGASEPSFDSGMRPRGPGPYGEGGPGPRFPRQQPGLAALWPDYLARVLVMGLAAWFGAGWLAKPVRRLTAAAQALTLSLDKGQGGFELDEHQGTVEVRQAARVFNEMGRRLRGQFAERSLFMAAVSHDLRTPLTRLRLRLDRLQPDPLVERCIADVREMDTLLQTMLDVLHDQRAQESTQAVDLGALAQALADDAQDEGRQVAVAGSGLARAQPQALRRVIGNLLGNALKHAGSGVRIVVEAEAGGERICIAVEDDGPGIPEGQLADAFRPFFRLDASRSRATGGSGLGLYIARELTLRQNGEIRLRNRPQGGLRAEVLLPCA